MNYIENVKFYGRNQCHRKFEIMHPNTMEDVKI